MATLVLGAVPGGTIGEISFKKRVIDTRCVAEGVAVGDVNRDGKLDVVAGNVSYQAPKFTPHEIAPVLLVDPKQAYSKLFQHLGCRPKPRRLRRSDSDRDAGREGDLAREPEGRRYAMEGASDLEGRLQREPAL